MKKLNHSFGETIVAKDIDFQCRKGEVIALIGPNGTGKSTIGRILAGLLKEKSGEVVLFGKHCRPKSRLWKGLVHSPGFRAASYSVRICWTN
ncbi:MAG: ATP-binding cassette domain-containing protein [Dorea sp.]